MNSVAAGIRRSEHNLDSSLNIVKGWDRDGDFDGQLGRRTGHNSTHVARSGSVFVQHTDSDGGNNPKNNIVTTPRDESRANEEDATFSSRKIRVKRSGSVLIEGLGGSGSTIVPHSSGSPIGHGHISALRKRIAELENELSEAKVKLGRSERNRLAQSGRRNLCQGNWRFSNKNKKCFAREGDYHTRGRSCSRRYDERKEAARINTTAS